MENRLSIVKARYKISFIDLVQWFALSGIVLGRHLETVFIIIVSYMIIIRYKRFYHSNTFMLAFVTLFITSIFLISFNSYEIGKFAQQFILIIIFFFCYFQIFSVSKDCIESFFQKYLKLSYLLCIIGLIQFIIFFLIQIDIVPYTFDGETQFSYSGRFLKVHSILTEPGNLGTFLVPAVSYVIFNKNYRNTHKKESILYILILLLTFTTISYVALTFIIFVKMLQTKFFKYICIGVSFIIIPFIFNAMSASVEEEGVDYRSFSSMIKGKIIQTSIIFQNVTPENFEGLNESSYALLSNFWVATNAPNRLFGTGLGTHQENYEKLYQSDYRSYGLNKADGYSLLVRLFSEFGFIGLAVYLYLIIKNFNKKSTINISVLFIIIALLMRGGHYTLYGTVFFHFIYFYTSKRRLNYEPK